MDICHLNNAELEAKHQKYKGRVVLRGDIVKDDSESYAVFTEQGASASQIDCRKSNGDQSKVTRMRRTSSWCSTCLHSSKNGRCSQIIENSRIGMSRHSDSSTTTQMAWIIFQYGRPSRSSWAESVRSSFGRTVVGKAIWENPIEVRLGVGFQLGMFICTQWKWLFLSVYVDDITLAGKKQNVNPMWKVQNKEVDLGQPTSFLDHVYLGCTQRPCETCKDIVDSYRTMFESRLFAGATEKQPNSEQLSVSSWSYDIEGHAKMCVWNVFVSWQTKLLDNFTRYQRHALMVDSKKEELKSVVVVRCMLSNFTEMFVFGTHWKTWLFFGQPTNLHDRSRNGPRLVTNDWVVWSPTFISRVNTKNVVMWETLPNNVDWDFFKTLLQEILRIQNLLRVEHCAYSEATRLFR